MFNEKIDNTLLVKAIKELLEETELLRQAVLELSKEHGPEHKEN